MKFRYDPPESDSNRSSLAKPEMPEIPEVNKARGPRPETPVEIEKPQEQVACQDPVDPPKIISNCVFIASILMVL